MVRLLSLLSSLVALLTSLHTHMTFRLPPSSYVEFLLFFARYISFFLYNFILTTSTCTLQLAFVLLQLHQNAKFHALFLVSKFFLLPFDSLSLTFPFLAPPVDSGSDSESSSHLQLNGTSFWLILFHLPFPTFKLSPSLLFGRWPWRFRRFVVGDRLRLVTWRIVARQNWEP